MVQIKGQYTLEDFKKAHQLHARQSAGAPATRLFLMLLTVLFFVSMFLLAIFGRLEWAYFWAPLALLTIFLLYRYIYRPFSLSSQYKKQKELLEPFEMELSEEGLFVRNPNGQAMNEWGNYMKWLEGQELVLLYRTRTMFQMIPKRLFSLPGDLQYLRDQLTRNNIPDVGKTNLSISRNRLILYAILLVAIIVMVLLFLK